MRGVFDEREAERERRRRGREGRDRENGRGEKRDRELTLGSFTLLAILFGLVVLCGLSFGLGYVVGRREPVAQATVLEPTPIAAQGDSAKSKPSGRIGSGSGSGAQGEASSPDGGGAGGKQAVNQQQGNDAGGNGSETGAAEISKGTQSGAHSGVGAGQVQPALANVTPAPAKTVQSETRAVQPALEPATKKGQPVAPLALMVQIATLANQEDADVLVEALRRRGYAVAAQRDAADAMVHVRVGPFASRDIANQWRQKLLNDGYNAVVQ
jgi:hypothetical protein